MEILKIIAVWMPVLIIPLGTTSILLRSKKPDISDKLVLLQVALIAIQIVAAVIIIIVR